MNKIIEFFKNLFSNLKEIPVEKPIPVEVPKPAEKKPIAICPDNEADYEAKFYAAKTNQASNEILIKKAKTILANVSKYQAVAKYLNLPDVLISGNQVGAWIFIAAIHNQESARDVGLFQACLHNGERIIGTGKKTTLVPKDKGPFATWEAAAFDALKDERRIVNKKTKTLGQWLELLEAYNGMGYRKHGVSSPYLWAMTDQYTKGYYSGDGNWQSELVTDHFGAVAVIKMVLSSISFDKLEIKKA